MSERTNPFEADHWWYWDPREKMWIDNGEEMPLNMPAGSLIKAPQGDTPYYTLEPEAPQ